MKASRIAAAIVTGFVTAGTLTAAYRILGTAGIRRDRSAGGALAMTPGIVHATLEAEIVRRVNLQRARIVLGSGAPTASPSSANTGGVPPSPMGSATVTRPGVPPVAVVPPSDPAEYVAQAFEAARPDLTRRLARLVNVERLNHDLLETSPAERNAPSRERLAVRKQRIRPALRRDLNAIDVWIVGRDWTRALSDDPVMAKAAAQLAKLPSLDAGLTDLVDWDRLGPALVDRLTDVVAADFSEASGFPALAVDLQARLTWSVTALLFCGLWLGMMAITLWFIATLDSRGAVTRTIVTVIAAIVAGRLISAFSPSGSLLFGSMEQLREGLGQSALVDLTSAVAFMNGLAAAAAVTLLMFTWFCYAHAPKDTPDLESVVSALRMSFDIGAVLLTAGVLEIAALYSWPAALMPDAASAEHSRTVARYIAAYAGVLFSLTLALAYLPAPTIVAAHEAQLGAPRVGITRGFGETALQQFGRLVQIFLPLIAGLPFSLLLPSK